MTDLSQSCCSQRVGVPGQLPEHGLQPALVRLLLAPVSTAQLHGAVLRAVRRQKPAQPACPPTPTVYAHTHATYLRNSATRKTFFSPLLTRVFNFVASSLTAFIGGHACQHTADDHLHAHWRNTLKTCLGWAELGQPKLGQLGSQVKGNKLCQRLACKTEKCRL